MEKIWSCLTILPQERYTIIWVWDLRNKMPQNMWKEYLQWFRAWTEFQEKISGKCVSHSLLEERVQKILKERCLKIVHKEYSIGNYKVDLIVEDEVGNKVAIEIGGLFTREPSFKLFELCQEFDYVLHIPYESEVRIYSKSNLPPEPPILPKHIRNWLDKKKIEQMKEMGRLLT